MKSKYWVLLAAGVLIGFLSKSKASSIFGSADSFAALGGTSVTSAGNTILNGDLGVYPVKSLVGFGPGIVNGATYVGGPSAQEAQADGMAAYNTLAGETPGQDLSGQDLGTLILMPGTYFFSASAQLTGPLTLDAGNDSNARFDFLIGSTLTTASSASVVLMNGAQADNVYWQVGTSATCGPDTSFDGSILADQNITLDTGAGISGRAFALNGALTLNDNVITVPSEVPEPSPLGLSAFCAFLFCAWTWGRQPRIPA